MKPRLDPSPTVFAITVVLAIFIHFPSLRCQATRSYDTCGQSLQCGNIQFEYPFWGSGRPLYCGHPGFQITCTSNVPVLASESVGYRVVQDPDSSTRTITVARNDLWDTTCPQPLYNTTYNVTRYNGNNLDQENVSLYYGCQNGEPSPGGTQLASNYQFSCEGNNGTQSDGFFYRTNLIDPTIGDFFSRCDNYITVPVNQSSANQLSSVTATLSDLRSSLRNGFKLQWTANNNECERCIRSDGRCGSDATSPDVFVCYCANGSVSLTCNSSNDNVGDLRSALTACFKLEWTGNNDKCDRCVRSDGQCGSNAASHEVFACYCASGNFSSTFNISNESVGGGSRSTRSTRKIIIGISCGIAGIMFLSFVILFQKKRLSVTSKRHDAAKDQIEIFIRNYGSLAPKIYKYSEIKKITNSFLEKLGQGGYGSVYKGQLPGGRLVAVKLLSEVTGDGEDFINEVASISRTSHVNIVTLLGFCFDRKKRALLYEFMPNGSLDRFLHRDGIHLDWNTLFQIAKGIIRGLEYLHRGCNTRIVHFDIKPHNILLNEEFVPKISDFGLAKLCKTKESIVSVLGARGTAGYMAPEVFLKNLGGASHKSDVYSYGMMVLEMTGARKHNNSSMTSTSEAYFPDWIYKQVEVGGDLGDYGVKTEEEEELARKMMTVSLWCIQSNPSDRPSISKVVEMLEGSFESLQVPPRRFDSSPVRPFQSTPPSSMQSSSADQRVSTNSGKGFST